MRHGSFRLRLLRRKHERMRQNRVRVPVVQVKRYRLRVHRSILLVVFDCCYATGARVDFV